MQTCSHTKTNEERHIDKQRKHIQTHRVSKKQTYTDKRHAKTRSDTEIKRKISKQPLRRTDIERKKRDRETKCLYKHTESTTQRHIERQVKLLLEHIGTERDNQTTAETHRHRDRNKNTYKRSVTPKHTKTERDNKQPIKRTDTKRQRERQIYKLTELDIKTHIDRHRDKHIPTQTQRYRERERERESIK